MSASVVITRGTNDKPAASRALAAWFEANPVCTGHLLIGYPVLATAEGRFFIDALLVSPEKGVVIFDLIEGSDPGNFQERQDDAANKLESRLKAHRELMRRRDLLVPVSVISFAPGMHGVENRTSDDYPIANQDNLREVLSSIRWESRDNRVYEAALSAIQNISTIRRSRARRSLAKEDSRGGKLKRLEESIATLDWIQSRAVIETVDGVQRIRGLAGSGKTIVLALKAAYLHAQHPEWRIAVTFNTRSLKGHFRRLINNFTVEQTGDEPDWDNLRILNAWGAPGGGERQGLYHEFCQTYGVDYFDFSSARREFGYGHEFAGACERALLQARDPIPLYDVILVDEAQDFPPSFLRLCYEMLDHHKRLVYAYDELQNLSGASLPPPEEIFGKKSDGTPNVRFDQAPPDGPQRDVILEKCYRNSRPVLVTAHALGFGIYRQPTGGETTGLVQMFDHPHLWKEIGYHVRQGELREGAWVALCRTEESSPRFLEDHSPIHDLVSFHRFDDEDAQADWLVEAIKKNLEEDELRHDDIIVINPDPRTTRARVGLIRKRLFELGINSHLAGVDTDPDVFFKSGADSITFTGIYRAKGNEAGMVYVINAQDCESATFNLATIRNRLFTAITRSKAWVRVLGIGEGMDRLIEEFSRLKQNDFELRFTYPTREQREHLRIVHRDMTEAERKRVESREKSLSDLIKDLETGRVLPEHIDRDLREKLMKLLMNKG